MRILVFSTLFPNAAAPAHGVFVENRLSAYLKKYKAEAKVIAPVPWFPFSHPAFGRYAAYARAPRIELRNGLEVFHPRFLVPPKLGMRFAPASLERCLVREARTLIEEGWDFDFIDAHYFYPDGAAAAAAARTLGKPFVVTARGTDINYLPSFEGSCRRILDAARRADAIIAVADALKTELTRLGAQSDKITVLRNGVDLQKFSPA
ncbi:MAG: glycosyltransferase, partial [Oricola sp.]|nr:glycosyltransferase [Oricola sp.]